MPRTSLKSLISAAISLVALLLTITVSYVIGHDAITRLEQQIGRSLALLADEAQDKLDRAMFERLQALQNLAGVGEVLQKRATPATLRTTLETFQKTYSDYSWVGYADAHGSILGATKGTLEGRSVANQTWFQKGSREPFVGEVRLSGSAKSQTDQSDNSEANFIELAIPVWSADEGIAGTLGASLSAGWAEEVRDTLLGSLKDAVPADVIVLDEGGRVLFGPDDLKGQTLDLPSINAARTGTADFSVERWPDSKSYLTGFSKSDGYRSYAGLRWIVLVREEQHLAFAPAWRLLRNIVIWGSAIAGLAALLAWTLASRLSQPLLQLSNASERLRLGQQLEIPEIGGYHEVNVLSRSFRSLVADLGVQRASLAAANQSLEGQVRDRTEQLADQNISLEMAKTKAEQATDAKSRFLAAASHDLRQPLHALTLFARALSRRVSGDEATTLVAQMEEALRGLKGMFDALLNVSRLDAKLIEPTIAPMSVGEIIDRVSVGSRVEAEQSGLRFVSRRADWILQSDAALLETIVRNLVSNALKFTKHGGVLLAARMRGGQRVLDIYDTGPGLSSEQCDKIFEEFAREGQQASGANDGLGLGLSIARRYAGLLGMQIQVCSRPGHGSRFSVVLPSGGDSGHRIPVNSGPKSASAMRGANILILDDEPLIVAALRREISDNGNVAFGYQSCVDAERAIDEGVIFDAAVVDFDLRGPETGLAFIERLSNRLGKPVPALLLSGGTNSTTLAILAKSGRPWLTKPADPDLIIATLGAILNSSQAGRHVGEESQEPVRSPESE